MLDDQGEQLEKFEAGMDSINADMKLAEQALKSMDLLCGIFPKFWKKSQGFKEDDAVWGEQKVLSISVCSKFRKSSSPIFAVSADNRRRSSSSARRGDSKWRIYCKDHE